MRRRAVCSPPFFYSVPVRQADGGIMGKYILKKIIYFHHGDIFYDELYAG